MKLNLPPEYLLIHRVWLGGIGVLCQIDGTVPAGRSSSRTCRGCDCGTCHPPSTRAWAQSTDAENAPLDAYCSAPARSGSGGAGGVTTRPESSLPSMLRRWRRLQASQVQTSRPFSTPRAQVSGPAPRRPGRPRRCAHQRRRLPWLPPLPAAAPWQVRARWSVRHTDQALRPWPPPCGLLERAHLLQRVLVDDVGHAAVRARPRRRRRPPAPSRRAARRAACRPAPRRSAPSARRTRAAP